MNDHRPGSIIYLSGLTSTGKSSMIRELTARRRHMFFVLGFDLFEEIIPEWAYTDEYYSHAILAMYHAARSLAEQGHDVMIDGLIMRMPGLERHYEELKKIFDGIPLRIIDVYCALEELERRNIARGDRRPEQSYNQSKLVEPGIDYDLHIDSGRLSIAECVDILLDHIAPSPV